MGPMGTQSEVQLHEHLVVEHGYGGSYKSVLRYVRRRWGSPKIRTWRRVETPPGAQSQTDWGTFPRVWIAGEPVGVYSFVMGLSFSRMPAIVWSERKDQVSWLSCHNAAYRRLGGVAAVNRIDNSQHFAWIHVCYLLRRISPAAGSTCASGKTPPTTCQKKPCQQ